MRRRFIWLLALALAACGSPGPKPPEPLAIDIGEPPLLAAPLYALAERRPDLLRLRNVSESVALSDLAGHRVAGAVLGPGEASPSRPALATVAQLEPSWLLGRAPDPNFIWTSLTDKLVLAAPGTSGAILRWAFRQHSLRPERQFLIGLGPRAFAEGSGDFLQLIPPFPKLRAQPVAAVGLEAGPLLRAVLVGGGSASRRERLVALVAAGEALLAAQPSAAIPGLERAFPSGSGPGLRWAVRWGALVRLWPKDPRLNPVLVRHTRLLLGPKLVPDDALDFGPADRFYLKKWTAEKNTGLAP